MIKYFILLGLMLFAKFTNCQNIICKELLGRPTNNSITIRMFFDEKGEAQAQFGKQETMLDQATEWVTSDIDNAMTIVIANLLPDTKYYYRINYKKPGENFIQQRPVYSFHTQRSKESTYTFVVQADPHLDEMSDTALYRRCLRNQLEDEADFMIDLGDIIMTDKLKNASGRITRDTIVSRCRYMREYYTTACHSLPLFLALGNHEGEAGWQLNGTGENIAVWNAIERKKYFTNPIPDWFYNGDDTENSFIGKRENYYSWTWGDALFIVLDPYWYTNPKPDGNTGWRWTLGKKQYDWLRTTLEQSNEKYKFLFSHQLIGGDPMGRGGIEFAEWFEWGGYNKDGSYGFDKERPGWGKPIKDILAENKVSIFFHGHDHFFGKQEKECLIYQECPQPSLPNFNSANQADDYGYVSGQILPNAGHLRVTVSPDETKVEYIRVYLPQNENVNRKNKDISATYFIKNLDCYDTLSTGISPVIWNADYKNEIVFPNPYSEETTIQFSLKQTEKISIQLFNEEGIKVKDIINNSLIPAGDFQIYLDGNHFDQPLMRGIYFYNITASGKTIHSGKIIKI